MWQGHPTSWSTNCEKRPSPLSGKIVSSSLPLIWSQLSIIKEPSVWWWPRCVSSEDQSSCLRQTGCNQACHIDHHQALLHHRRSIHHCIGGAAHSLVTAPTPLQPPLGFFQTWKKDRKPFSLGNAGWSDHDVIVDDEGHQRVLLARWQLGVWHCATLCDSPSEWQTGRHFSAVPPNPSPQRPGRHQIYFAVHLI